MRKLQLKLLALLLVLCMVLSGCLLATEQLLALTKETQPAQSLDSLEYTRPKQSDLQIPLDACKELAQEGTSIDDLIDAILTFYDAYDLYMDNCAIADLRYYADVTDSYWAEENTYCTNHYHLAGAALDELYYALAKSPLLSELESEENFGADFFDAYQGDATGTDPQLLALYEQESALINDYYDLVSQFDGDCDSHEYFTKWQPQFTQVYIDLVKVRQKIATATGFDSYGEYAYAVTYSRDYSPQQAEQFLLDLKNALYEDYYRFDHSTYPSNYCSEESTFQYVKTAANAMGGDIQEAFQFLEENKLYDISYGSNKYDICYEIYLWSYQQPVIFVAPYQDQTDKLSFAHEFGHFTNDYLCSGSYASIDVAEVHSQAFEYLSLLYADASDTLVRFKLYDSLCTYMETSAYALFEHQVYQMTDSELTVENVTALANITALQFGFDSWGGDGSDFVTVGHFYTHPMYMISYVVSNDLAMQFYQLELEQSGQGLALYQQCLYSEDSYLLDFAQQYGLESPFAPGRLEAVAETFRNGLH